MEYMDREVIHSAYLLNPSLSAAEGAAQTVEEVPSRSMFLIWSDSPAPKLLVPEEGDALNGKHRPLRWKPALYVWGDDEIW